MEYQVVLLDFPLSLRGSKRHLCPEFECSALMRETLEEYPDKKSKRQRKRIRNLVAKNNKYRGRRLSSLKIYNRKKLNRDAIFQGIRDTDHLGES